MSISSSFAVSMMIGTWLRAAQAAADLDPVELRQHDVEDDEVEPLLGEAIERLAAVAGGDHLVSVLAQRIPEQGLNGVLVVDEEDPRAHLLHTRKRRYRAARDSVFTLLRVRDHAWSTHASTGLAFAPALVALVVLMFSVEPIPEPVQTPETFASDFDGRRAAATAREIVEVAPERTPGSAGDEASADARRRALRRDRLGQGLRAGLRRELRRRRGRASQRDPDPAGELRARRSSSSPIATPPAGRARPPARPPPALLLEAGAELGRTAATRRRSSWSPPTAARRAEQGIREFFESYPTLDQVRGSRRGLAARGGRAGPATRARLVDRRREHLRAARRDR